MDKETDPFYNALYSETQLLSNESNEETWIEQDYFEGAEEGEIIPVQFVTEQNFSTVIIPAIYTDSPKYS